MKSTRKNLIIGVAIAMISSGCDSDSSSQSAGSSNETQSQSANNETPAQNANSCTSPLVMSQTGSDPECGEGNVHAWPVGMAAVDCHGWASIDDEGKQHDNSANNIRCGADGKLHFTQFAGTLNCEGGQEGVNKEAALNVCEQDIPPTLYTEAIDLTCCADPESPECKSGIPSVSVEESTIYLNGQPCSEE